MEETDDAEKSHGKRTSHTTQPDSIDSLRRMVGVSEVSRKNTEGNPKSGGS